MKRLFIATLFAVTAVPVTASAQPTESTPSSEYVEVWANARTRYVDVYLGDLNLADPRDRDEAAWRIHNASNNACRPVDLRALDEARDWRVCRFDAFEGGMAELEGRAPPPRRGRVYIREHLPGDDDDDD
jgi:UrcA family protein